jgi:hypothetical protein
MKAVSVDLIAIFRFCVLSNPSVKPMNIGVLIIGFIIAKNPAKTANIKAIII